MPTSASCAPLRSAPLRSAPPAPFHSTCAAAKNCVKCVPPKLTRACICSNTRTQSSNFYGPRILSLFTLRRSVLQCACQCQCQLEVSARGLSILGSRRRQTTHLHSKCTPVRVRERAVAPLSAVPPALALVPLHSSRVASRRVESRRASYVNYTVAEIF